MLPGLAFLTWWAQALLPTLTWPWPLRQSLLYILCSFCTANISTIINTTFHCVPIFNVLLQDGDILLTMNYSGHFFSKLVNSSGHFLRVNSLGQFLVNSHEHFLSMRILLLGWIFVDIFWVNSSGHFFMVITNSANTVDQAMQGVRGQKPCLLLLAYMTKVTIQFSYLKDLRWFYSSSIVFWL